jgi:hypothetical protein
MVNDIKIINGKDGLFISMPSRRKKNGEFKDVAHPLNNETRRMVESRVLAEYQRVLEGRAPVASSARMSGEITIPEQPEPEPQAAKSVDEVAEHHLRDSFWTV